ncbi:MAG: hypothetical protein BMS9Abin18_0373 [Zetaproteobacteria bacterium]|nr:MAG: hypothetical protein BMS9Abin18_0373 [Zetaproteobacteria bacterium]
MKKQILTIVMVAGVVMFAATPTFACSTAGPNKHVGQVTAVNTKAGTFTIMDAETRKPITFAASAGILKDAAKAKGSVMVSYEQSDGKMVAKDIHF